MPNITQLNKDNNFDIVNLYCIIDDAIKELGFDKTRTGRRPVLSLSDIATISLIKSRYGIKSWKQLYLLLQDMFGHYFQLPAYQNFILSMNKGSYVLLLVINSILSYNRNHSHPVKFVDSTPVPVCSKLHISSHKVMSDYATISKSTTGWYYGLKLHSVIDYENTPLYFTFTLANIDDRVPLESIFRLFSSSSTNSSLSSIFVADKGYQSREKEELAKEYNHILLTGKRKSKKLRTLASQLDIHLLHQRARIEAIFSLLKERLNLVNTLPRSVLGYLSHYIHTIFGYLIGKCVS